MVSVGWDTWPRSTRSSLGFAPSCYRDGLGFKGQLIVVTFANEPMLLTPSILMRGARSITGWVGGDMQDALRFSVLTGVLPMVETFPLAQAAAAYQRMMSSEVKFRSVLTMGQ